MNLMQDLKLKRNLIVFDLETTGTNTYSDRIVEIGALVIEPNGRTSTYNTLVNPEMPIPSGATKIHGISDEDVKDAPTFRDIKDEVFELFNDADLCGYNSNNFDIPLLVNEFKRFDIEFDLMNRFMLDACYIFKTKQRRDLTSAYKFYLGKQLENSHSAMADLMATFEIIREQANRYPDLEWDMEVLHNASRDGNNVDLSGKLVYNENGEACINFGQWKGQPVKRVIATDPNYIEWMLKKGDFPRDTRNHLKAIVEELKTKK